MKYIDKGLFMTRFHLELANAKATIKEYLHLDEPGAVVKVGENISFTWYEFSRKSE
jgi:hypothetical protein